MVKWTLLIVGLAAAVALAGLRGLAADTGSTSALSIGLGDNDDNPARRDDLSGELSVEIDDDEEHSGDPDVTGNGVSLDAPSVATGGQASVGAAPASIDSPSGEDSPSIQVVNPAPQSIDSLESGGASVDSVDSASAGDFDSRSNGASSG